MLNRSKKVLSMILALVMTLSLFEFIMPPIKAYAADIGLHLLLRSYNAVGGAPLTNTNLIESIFKPTAETALSDLYSFTPRARTEYHAYATKSMQEMASKSSVDLKIGAAASVGMGMGKGKDKDWLWKAEASYKYGKFESEAINSSYDKYYFSYRAERQEGVNRFADQSHPDLMTRLQEQVNDYVMNILMYTREEYIERDIFERFGTHFVTAYGMGGWMEQTTTTIQTKDSRTIEEKRDDDVKLGAQANVGISASTEATVEYHQALEERVSSSAYESRTDTIVEGGDRGLLVSETSIADLNGWTASFNPVKGSTNNCSILLDDDLYLVGIWELLPDTPEYTAQRRAIMNKFIDITINRDLEFYDTFIYKALKPMPKSVEVKTFASGSPNLAGKIPINNKYEFANIGFAGYPLNGNYVLTSDLDLTGVTEFGLSGDKTFTGTFDGSGHTIYNYNPPEITNTAMDQFNGLFGMNRGTIKNLNIQDSTLVCSSYLSRSSGSYVYAGLLCARNQGTIENCRAVNCTVKNAVQRYWFDDNAGLPDLYGYIYSGGLVGVNDGIIHKSSFVNPAADSIYASAYLIGYSFNGYFPGYHGKITLNTGGIVGQNNSIIRDCYSDVKINSKVTGIAQTTGTYFMSYFMPEVCLYTGGITGGVGGDPVRIQRCFARGTETSSVTPNDGRVRPLVYKTTGKLTGFNDPAWTSVFSNCYYITGQTAVGNGSSAGTTAVSSLKDPVVVNALTANGWEYKIEYPHPRLPSVALPGFAVYFKNGFPDYEVGFAFDYDLSKDMTVYFAGVKNITRDVDVRYNFCAPGEETIQFSYKDMNNTVYLAELKVNVKPLNTDYLLEDLCEINGVKYKKFHEALAAVPANAPTPTTIKLLKDFTYNEGIYLLNKKINLDLNGKTLNVVNDNGEGLQFGGIAGAVAGLWLDNSFIHLLDPYHGAFHITAISDVGDTDRYAIGVRLVNGSEAEVTNVTARSDVCGVALYVGDFVNPKRSEVIVYGDVTYTALPYNAAGQYWLTERIVGVHVNQYSYATIHGKLNFPDRNSFAYPSEVVYIIAGSDKQPYNGSVSAEMPGYLEYSTPGYNAGVWVKQEIVCEIVGGQQYAHFYQAMNALQAAPYNGSGMIRLLEDIDEDSQDFGGGIGGMDVTFDLNGKNMTWFCSASDDTVLWQNSGSVKLLSLHNGAFNIDTGTVTYGGNTYKRLAYGMIVTNGAQATVSNVTSRCDDDHCAVTVQSGGEVTVTGSVTSVQRGVIADGGTVFVKGDVHVEHDTGSPRYATGVHALNGGTVVVDGRIYAERGWLNPVSVGGTLADPGNGYAPFPSETMPGYHEYTDGTSHVFVKDPTAPVILPNPKPIGSPASGAVVSGTRISLMTEVFGGAIYYTTNGMTPTTASTRYTTPIVITGTPSSPEVVIKAITVKPGIPNSEVAEFRYTVKLPDKANKPTASHLGGVVAEGKMISLMTSTEGAEIYYTTDNSEPTALSELYIAPIEINEDTVLKAIAVLAGTGVENSAVATFIYVLDTSTTPMFIGAHEAGIAGDEIEINVSILNNHGIGGFTINMDYDSTKLEYVSTTGAANLPGGTTSANSPGRVRTLWSNAAGITWDGILYSVRFKIKDGTEWGEIPLRLYLQGADAIVTTTGVELNSVFVDGSIEVSPLIMGDVNGDGRVNVGDLLMVSQYIVEGYGIQLTGNAYLGADMNNDAKINTVDTVMLAQRIVRGTDYGIDFGNSGSGAARPQGMQPAKGRMSPSSAIEDGSVIRVGLPSGKLKHGDEFDVTVSIENNTDSIAGLTLDLLYDDTVFELIDVSQDGSPFQPMMFVESSNVANKLRILMTHNEGFVIGDGLLYTLKLRVREGAAEGNYAFDLFYEENGGIVDDTWASVNPGLANGSVQIGAAAALNVSFRANQIGGEKGKVDSKGIELLFTRTVLGLTADDIIITNGTGAVTKGSLIANPRDRSIWTVILTNVAEGGTVTVAVKNFDGYVVNTASQVVDVHKAEGYSLTVAAELGGMVSGIPSGSYTEGTVISVKADADKGYQFDSWTVKSDAEITIDKAGNPAMFHMPEGAVSLIANFAPGSVAGVAVSGTVVSYNPKNAVTIDLMDGRTVAYTTTIAAGSGSGQVTQTFTIPDVAAGVYSVRITKPGHLSGTIAVVTVSGAAVNIGSVTLLAGDLNGDGKADATDLSVLLANFGKAGGEITNQAADINGDGKADATDMSVLLANFGKSST